MAPKDMKTNACICCYQALDLADIKLLCVSEGEQCCIFSKTCLAAGEDVLGPGMIEVDKDKGEICNLGLGICSYGLKTPAVCCKSRQSCLCYKTVAALPFDDDFVPGPVCAGIPCPGFQLMPQAGAWCRPTPRSGSTSTKTWTASAARRRPTRPTRWSARRPAAPNSPPPGLGLHRPRPAAPNS